MQNTGFVSHRLLLLTTQLFCGVFACSDIEEDCSATNCCKDASLTCRVHNGSWASCTRLLFNTMRRRRLAPKSDASPPLGSPVAQHGQLEVMGSNIVNKDRVPVRLRGVSLFWSQWKPAFWNADSVHWLAKDWRIQIVRAAMAVEHDGYLMNPDIEREKLEAVVDAAIDAGIYVLIDWHDHNANTHLAQASDFFDEMAEVYGSYPNVLFETFNEPEHQIWSSEIKPYHEAIVGKIRRHTGNLILLGSRLYDQEVEEASLYPVSGTNLVYTVHFYAGSAVSLPSGHGEGLRQKVLAALRNGVAVFASEWGACNFTGGGDLDLNAAQEWFDFLETHKISDANWAISDLKESCSALRPGSSGRGRWVFAQLTASGRFVRNSIRLSAPEPWTVFPACTDFWNSCRGAGCSTGPSLTCNINNEWSASCLANCTPSPMEYVKYGTPWSCNVDSGLLNGAVRRRRSKPKPNASAPVGSPVAQHGRLRTNGSTIINEAHEPVHIRGVSLYWSQWKAELWNADSVYWLASDWRIQLIRAAMAVEHGGYLTHPDVERAKVEAVVDAAIKVGIYVIIDWHDHHANSHLPYAAAFFDEMAEVYGSYPNVLFETFNEPGDISWSTEIKPYHEEMVCRIRRHTDNLIILGSRLYDQEVEEASLDPVSGTNLAYTLHFYAGSAISSPASHGRWLRQKAIFALANGIPLFVTEWGACDYTGDGDLDVTAAQVWIDFLAAHNISDANWAISDVAESCSALKPESGSLGRLSKFMPTRLTQSGSFVRESIVGSAPPAWTVFPLCSDFDEDCGGSGCCNDADMLCYEKDERWSTCLAAATCPPDESDGEFDTSPWSCELIPSPLNGPMRRRRSAAKPNASAPAGSPVARHGRLATNGSTIINEAHEPVRLRGVSLFWSQWEAEFWNADSVYWLASDWRIQIVRAAMAVEHGGYLLNAEVEREKVEAVVDAAIEVGIYVLIDWHDHNADYHLPHALRFFDEMAEVYGSYPNVLFETFNEPVGQNWSSEIKPYHEEVVRAIRRHTENIVILGTPVYDQEVEEASLDPVNGPNLAYTVHFYAGSAESTPYGHGKKLRERVVVAMANGIPIFATEWGTCEYTGDGDLDLRASQEWLDFLEAHGISDINWAAGDQDESCAALRAGSSSLSRLGRWLGTQLTFSGAFVRKSILASAPEAWTEFPLCSNFGDNCRGTGCCSDASLRCYEKNQWWWTCLADCAPGQANDDFDNVPWSCNLSASPLNGPMRRRRSVPKPNVSAPPLSPVARHGSLRTRGNTIINEDQEPVRLRGVSLYWSQWKPEFWNADLVRWLALDWRIQIIRAAMAVESGGFLTNADVEREKVETVVDAAIEVGIYVLVDWHDHNANYHLPHANAFFGELAEVYGSFPNVLFETFNEPSNIDWSSEIKPYHEAVVRTIRQHTENLVIVGSRLYDQEVEEASLDPVNGTNLAYTLHFYAGSAVSFPFGHGEGLRQKALAALGSAVPIFATEWGTCNHTGNGDLDLNASLEWLEFLEAHNISDTNWAISDVDESCSALKLGSSPDGQWSAQELTRSGVFVRESIRSSSATAWITTTVTTTTGTTSTRSGTWLVFVPAPNVTTTDLMEVADRSYSLFCVLRQAGLLSFVMSISLW